MNWHVKMNISSAPEAASAETSFRTRIILSVLFAVLLSTFFLLIAYPGILSPDSITHWDQAKAGQYNTIKPPLLSFIQSLFLVFFDLESALPAFSFVQSMLFWFSMFFFLACISTSVIVFIVLSFAICLLVPLWPYSVVHWTDVWVLFFFVFSVSFFELLRRSGYKSRGYLAAGIFFLFLTASTRHNAVSVLPIAVLPLAHVVNRYWHKGLARSALAASLIVPILFMATKVFLLPPQVEISKSLLPFGLLNPYLGIVANSSEEKKAQLFASDEASFDERFGQGSFKAAIDGYNPGFNTKMTRGERPILKVEGYPILYGILANGDFIKERFLHAAAISPEGLLKHKWAYIKGQFGAGASKLGFNWRVKENRLGVKPDPFFPTLNLEMTRTVMGSTKTLLGHHWFAFLVGAIAVLINLATVRAPVVLWLFAGSVLYAVPYAIAETGWEWRYLMPSYTMNFLAAAALVGGLARYLKPAREMPGSSVPMNSPINARSSH